MRNRHVADAFRRLADLIEFRGLDLGEARGYRTAAYFLRGLQEDVDELCRSGRLPQVPELGPRMARRIREFLETGRLRRMDDLLHPVGEGVLEILALPGVKVDLLARIHLALGIRSLKDLEAAHGRGREAELGALLKNREWENLTRGLEGIGRQRGRRSLGDVHPVVEELLGVLRGATGCSWVRAVGSYAMGRLWHERIEVHAAVPRETSSVFREIFRGLPGLTEARSAGQWREEAFLENGVPLVLRCVPELFRGGLSTMATAAPGHVEKLRLRAKARGMRLAREYLYRGKRRVESPDEETFYASFDLPWIPPELREGRGEIAQAADGMLPALVRSSQLRGDLHVHSSWSDGGSDLESISNWARRRGLEWVAICDHSEGLAEARGLNALRLRRRNARIDALNASSDGPVLLKGAEVEIRPDGSLDYSPEILSELDLVVGAVHHDRRGRGWMTDRITRAMNGGWVDVLAHPSGSLVGSRPPYAVDMEELFRVAASRDVALEINGHRSRMDLSPRLVRQALSQGLSLAMGSDAHQAEDMGMLDLAVIIARRGGAPARSILNTLDLEALRAWRQARRKS